jgi:hypothetical protein
VGLEAEHVVAAGEEGVGGARVRYSSRPVAPPSPLALWPVVARALQGVIVFAVPTLRRATSRPLR